MNSRISASEPARPSASNATADMICPGVNNTHGTRLYHHPVVGSLTLDYEIFSPAGDEDQRLVLHTAEPGSPSERGGSLTPLRKLPLWPNIRRRCYLRRTNRRS